MIRPSSRKNLRMAIAAVAASGMGLGLSPIASGTIGSLWGVLLVLLVWPSLTHPGSQAILCFALILLAIPICHWGEKWFEKKDDGRIVADEYLAFPICMIGLPLDPDRIWILILAFLTFRFFDIVKPPPARGWQRFHGGFGIVVDDFIAALYSLAANHLIVLAATRWFSR